MRRVLLMGLAAGAMATAGVPAQAIGATHRTTGGTHHGGRKHRRSVRGTHCAGSASFHAGAGKRPPARCGHRQPAHRGACANTSMRPDAADLAAIRAAVLCLVNQARAARGEAPLRANARLLAAAQRHSESMGFGDYFSHTGPAGQTPLSRMEAAGYIYSSRLGYEVGENIGFGTLWLATPKAIVHAWMMSPGHRANILDARFQDTAVGVSAHPPAALAGGQRGAVYTQDFGVIVRPTIARHRRKK
ncbi:MAG TPA: CAP domain-containing protein [Solirubrobacteraceae bacterium]|nr:CAP domain-containing protein [Solirubrobacteraceae bacterium]